MREVACFFDKPHRCHRVLKFMTKVSFDPHLADLQPSSHLVWRSCVGRIAQPSHPSVEGWRHGSQFSQASEHAWVWPQRTWNFRRGFDGGVRFRKNKSRGRIIASSYGLGSVPSFSPIFAAARSRAVCLSYRHLRPTVHCAKQAVWV